METHSPLGLILTQGMSKTDLVCLSWDDYASWARVIPTLPSESSRNRRMPIMPGTKDTRGPEVNTASEKPAPPPRPPALARVSSGMNFVEAPASPRSQPRPPSTPKAEPPTMFRAQSFVHSAPITPESRPRPPNSPKNSSLESPIPPLQRAQSFVNTAPTTNDKQGVSSPRSLARGMPMGTPSESFSSKALKPVEVARAQSFVNVAPTTPETRAPPQHSRSPSNTPTVASPRPPPPRGKP